MTQAEKRRGDAPAKERQRERELELLDNLTRTRKDEGTRLAGVHEQNREEEEEEEEEEEAWTIMEEKVSEKDPPN